MRSTVDRMTVDSGTAPTRLERRKERTRQAMIDAAKRIVAERGTVSVTITEKPSGGICVDLSPNPSMLPDGDVKTTAQKIEKALASWGFINTIRTGYSATALKLAGQEEPDAGGAA